MKICVPLQNNDIDADYTKLKLPTHFGDACTFIVFDTIEQKIVGECELEKECAGPCHCPIPDISPYAVDAFAGPAMGFRLAQMARRNSKKVYLTKAPTLADVLKDFSREDFYDMAVPKGRCMTRLYG